MNILRNVVHLTVCFALTGRGIEAVVVDDRVDEVAGRARP